MKLRYAKIESLIQKYSVFDKDNCERGIVYKVTDGWRAYRHPRDTPIGSFFKTRKLAAEALVK